MRTPCSVVVAVLCTAFLRAYGDSLPAEVLEKARSASVEVLIRDQLRGGGAIVENEAGKAFVITAAHLFRSPKETSQVITHDGKEHFASLSSYDQGHDLALLEVEPSLSETYGFLSVASSPPPVSNQIYNLGPALKRRTLIIPGAVSDDRISYTDFAETKGHLAHFFVSGINPVLTSGGVWINTKGKIVGVQHGRLIGDKGAPSSGLSMVSPPAAIRNLISSNSVTSTPGIGGYLWELWSADPPFIRKFPPGTRGLIVNPIFSGGPLDRAGLRALDLIVACDGHPLRRRSDLLKRIRSAPTGTEFTLSFIRPGGNQVRKATLRTESLESLWQ
ncbi:MAG: S1C family serine protease [Verrucomicrobiota bacterium]